MSIPNTIRRLPRAMQLLPTASPVLPAVHMSALRTLATSRTRSMHTSRGMQALFGKGSAGEEAKREEEAKRRELLEAREREREAALAQAAELSSSSGGMDALEDIPESQLVVPPDYTVAPTVSEAAELSYVPAESVAGLERVGDLKGWWEREGHWGPENQLSVFAAPRAPLSDELMTVLVRQAVVEALVYKTKGEEAGLTKAWARVDKQVATKTAQVKIEEKDGGIALSGEVADVYEALNSSEGVTVEQESFSQEEAVELAASFDSTWQQISLSDPALKFAINKRIYQLTGHLISDSRLHVSHTVGQLLKYLLTPPKATTVAEQVRKTESLAALPNVKVFSRRVTPIDRRIMDGSWKKIEEELRKRKLPITGHEDLGDFAERKWVSIKA